MQPVSRRKSIRADASRRAFLVSAAALPVAAVAGTRLGTPASEAPAAAGASDDRGAPGGYRLSEHVLTYYRTAAF